MRTGLLSLLFLALAACGGESNDSTSPPAGGSGGSLGGAGTGASGGSPAGSGGTGAGSGGVSGQGGASVTPPVGASETVAVEFAHPSLSGQAPFDKPRTLRVPPGFGVRVMARVDKARFMLPLPDGSVLISTPSFGSIMRLTPASGGAAPVVSEFTAGLNRPHDLSLVTIGDKTWIYVGESNRIVRFAYTTGATTVKDPEVLVSGLPDESNSELGSQYGHPLKNFAIRGDRMYVAIASQSNADPSERDESKVTMLRAAVYEYGLDGSGQKLVARGLRNAEGLAISPEGDLWVAVNNRDNTPYPYQDGKHPYGKVVPEFVDDYPPEPFVKVVQGSDSGWPFCNPNPFTPSGRSNMPFDRDYDNNRDGQALDCGALAPMEKGFEPHSAPLGFSFWTGGPGGYANAAVAGLHGCWNCTKPRGYKVAMFPWVNGGPGDELVLVEGFLADPNSKESRWSRPVDVVPYAGGKSLLISDDHSGTVFELYTKLIALPSRRAEAPTRSPRRRAAVATTPDRHQAPGAPRPGRVDCWGCCLLA